jgi:HD-GYP domain-containing protein (c-di-GMP phosphodiesterase class II)
VLQHHERLDGTGYPRRLRGETILRAARVLAVADVVEAMSSHRPYRPARGLEAAMEEIEKGANVAYDGDTVRACARLFREGRFRFEEQQELTSRAQAA